MESTMKRYVGISSIFAIFLLSIFGIRPIDKKRCALEPHMAKNISLTSSSFIKDSPIPKKYVYTQCQGQNISPQLKWTEVCDAKSYVLIVDDPDAPSPKNPRPNPFVHWVVYDLPETVLELKEGASIVQTGGLEGKNDFGDTRYDGPCPPKGSGKHRYFFKIMALDIKSIKLKSGATKDQVLAAAQGHILASAQLIGTYEIP